MTTNKLNMNSPAHVHNFALKDVKIFIADDIPQEESCKIWQLTKFMGGKIKESLHEADCMITNNALNIQKIKDKELNIKVMTSDFIHEMWKAHQCSSGPVNVNDLHMKYELKIFQNLTIAFSGFGVEEKKTIQSTIESNGGKISKTYNKHVDILLLHKESIGNDKHRAAYRLNKLSLDIEWIYESIKKGYACNVELYKLKFNQTSTPEKTSTRATFGPEISVIQNASMTSIQSYLDETTPSVRESIVPLLRKSSKNTFVAPQPKVIKKPLITFMNGKVVHVYHQNKIIRELVAKYGAINVEENFENPVDYVICHEVFVDNFKLKLKNVKEIVNKAWLDDCIAKNMCVEIQEHHKIIKDSQVNSNILKGERFSSTNYNNGKKTFIAAIVKRLGGDFNESLKKSESPILISPTSEGVKYETAIEWRLTVLSMEWLINCYKLQARVDESPFIIGKSNVSNKNSILKRSSIIPSSQENELVDNLSESDPGICIRKKSSNNRDAMSLCSPLITREEKIRGLISNLQTPDRAIASRVLKECTNLKQDLSKTSESNISSKIDKKCMKLTDDIDSELKPYMITIRSDESPRTKYFHALRLKQLDSMYEEKPDKRPTWELFDLPPVEDTDQIKMEAEVNRWKFWKRVLPDYNSPDPRLDLKSRLIHQEENSIEATNFIPNSEETENNQSECSLIVPDFK
jgi:hypothetical protein